MRFSQQTQQTIRDTVHEVFGKDAEMKLFGSRLDDAARGGDIDLLITLSFFTSGIQRKSLQLVAKLQMRIGDRPIDILVIDPQTAQQPIHAQALRTGITL